MVVPYLSSGHWMATDLGWSFDSDFDWGWGPFHYGRWFAEPGIGWLWEPGDVWAPAWVSWRDGDELIGWAPLEPDWCLTPPLFVFIETRYFTRPRLHDYFLSPAQRLANMRRTRAIESGRTAWSPGPPVDRVQARVGTRIAVRHAAVPPPRRFVAPDEGFRPHGMAPQRSSRRHARS